MEQIEKLKIKTRYISRIEARYITNGEMKVGSRYVQVAKFPRRQINSTFEVIEYIPYKLVKAQSIGGSFPITFTRIVEPTPEGSKVTAIVSGDPKGFYKIAKPLMKHMVKRSILNDYKKFKTIMENK
jgi:hypothetical protein